ncbi:MAG: hypothetical protein SGI84_03945 [Gemmatimonadota bacterium]|nr:hypothetical protein [Gemmatimonadota bacterium]
MNDSTPRRQFVGRVLGGAAAMAAAPLISLSEAAAMAQITAPGSAPQQDAWDMSWVDRVKGDHRMVFDSPEISEGLGMTQVRSWMAGTAEVYGVKDDQMTAVLVIRHAGVPMVMGDSWWDKYELGKAYTLKDPTSGEDARRNPYINYKEGDRHITTWPDAGLDTLIGRGVIVLACHLALRNRASGFARRDGRAAADVYAEMRASLVPGVTVMPNGIFAVGRAQQAGCGFIRST